MTARTLGQSAGIARAAHASRMAAWHRAASTAAADAGDTWAARRYGAWAWAAELTAEAELAAVDGRPARAADLLAAAYAVERAAGHYAEAGRLAADGASVLAAHAADAARAAEADAWREVGH